MIQAGLGSGYAEQIIDTEIADYLSNAEGLPLSPVNLVVRIAFNPNVTTAWFSSVMGIINNVTMLAIIMSGAAVIREREHGTMDHLLAMPISPFQIAMPKLWAKGLIITVAVGFSLYVVVHTILAVPIAGSIPLFMLVFLPKNMLSGSNTPLESMPHWLATIMEASPSTHFVSFAQSILYRGAGLSVVWPQFLAVALIAGIFLALALWRFRSIPSATN